MYNSMTIVDPAKPFISVVIPTFNSESTIKPCLKSLLEQTSQKSFEIIIVDSGHDNTKEICKKFDKVRYYFASDCLSPGSARNFGVKKAKGDLIVFLDSDCIAPKDWLEKIIKDFNEYPNIVAVLGNYEGSKRIYHKILNMEYEHNLKQVGYFGGFVEGNAAFKKSIFLLGCQFGTFKYNEGELLITQIQKLNLQTLRDFSLRVTHLTEPPFGSLLHKVFNWGINYYLHSKYYYKTLRRTLMGSTLTLISIFGLFCFIFFPWNVIPFITTSTIFLGYTIKNDSIKVRGTPLFFKLMIIPLGMLIRWIFWIGCACGLLRYSLLYRR